MKSNPFLKTLDSLIRVLKRLSVSVFAITLLALFAFNLVFDNLDPLEFLFFTNMTSIRQNNMVSKLPKILKSSDNPDVLMLGSSISLYPMARLDDIKNKGKTRWDDTYVRYHCCPYQKAEYLKDGLEKNFDQEISLSNASVVAAIISDQFLILDKYIKSGKRPKVVLLFTAPRDFMLNNSSPIGVSPTFEVLADHHNFYDVMSNNPDFKSLSEFAIGQFFPLYNTRRDYKNIAVAIANRLAGRTKIKDAEGESPRPVNLFEVDKYWEAEAIYKQPPNNLRQLEYYRESYNPLDRSRIENQTIYFGRLLSLARRYGIKMIVVDTPMPQIHYDLIPGDGLETYRKALADGCKKQGAVLITPGKDQVYDLNDFEDVSHLNIRGGEKLCQHLFNAINKESLEFDLRPNSNGVLLGKNSTQSKQL